LITGLKAGRTFGPEPPFFVVIRDGRKVVGAAMRTPPLNLLLSFGTQERAIGPILDALERVTRDIPGIGGPKALAAIAAAGWSARRGVERRVAMSQRIYRLAKVISPRPVPWRMRVATTQERQR